TQLAEDSEISKVEVAGPGFINIWVSADNLTEVVRQVLSTDSFTETIATETVSSKYGDSALLAGTTINLEYVSANPTGPLHIGHARWAAVGDALGRLLQSAGAKVINEYYFNDHGVQIDRFTNSLLAAAFHFPPPDDGYSGDYISQIAEQILELRFEVVSEPNKSAYILKEGKNATLEGNSKDSGALRSAQAESSTGKSSLFKFTHHVRHNSTDSETVSNSSDLVTTVEQIPKAVTEIFREEGVRLMTGKIQQSLADFGVHFDVYFNEHSLYRDGEVEQAIQVLRDKNLIYENDGATWFASSRLGDDKDRVIVKSDGTTAYLAADIAYYYNKRQRGADVAVYMLGADHHGYVGRLKAVAAAFGDDPNYNLKVLIGQMVAVESQGEFSRLSKRGGTMVFLDDLIEAVGKDALKYSLTRSNPNRNMVLDLDLITKASTDNPIFYVKYVHARCCSVNKVAQQRGIAYQDQTWQLVEADKELVSLLDQFPLVLAEAVEYYEPYRICHFLETLAAAYHKWYAHNPILPKANQAAEPLHYGRLALSNAVRTVIRHTLEDLLGLEAPQRM
ncbi:MAG: arginine--tRNA ligase, partial [Bifidobacteriaceae bacterium]|nr:arginine--tRNA ligase [Bifidobacteriaceae bacterium]